MKKILLLLIVAGMTTFLACGPSEKEKAAKAKQDSIARADSISKLENDVLASCQEHYRQDSIKISGFFGGVGIWTYHPYKIILMKSDNSGYNYEGTIYWTRSGIQFAGGDRYNTIHNDENKHIKVTVDKENNRFEWSVNNNDIY